VIECPEPPALANFYCAVLGMEVYESIRGRDSDPHGWVVIGHDGKKELAFQRSETAPTAGHARLHLDIFVDDIEEAERSVLALGASRTPNEHETGFRVFTDPAGHPFCLVFGAEFAPR
jgi:catechol 2,3-dioxygenase-like lactoylglutathione lyase family enzyme